MKKAEGILVEAIVFVEAVRDYLLKEESKDRSTDPQITLTVAKASSYAKATEDRVASRQITP